MKIGFLGIGLMGLPMVRNLASAGHEVAVWNRSRSKAEAVADVAIIVDAPADVALDAGVIISMLADGPTTQAVLDGGGVISAAKVGAVIVNMGSVEPARDVALGQKAQVAGVHYLDAPVSGGVAGAEAATLAILAGGTADAVAIAKPVFDALGRVTHVGPAGAGQTVKLANQLIVGATIGAVAEGLKLAESAGCDPAIVREALRGGFADSRIMELHGDRMARRDFEPGAKASTQLKDMRNAMAVIAQAELQLPIAAQVTQAYSDLVEVRGGGELDHAAYYLWLEMTGAPEPGTKT